MKLTERFTIKPRSFVLPPTVGDVIRWLDTLTPAERETAMLAEFVYDGGYGIAEKLEWIPGNEESAPRINING